MSNTAAAPTGAPAEPFTHGEPALYRPVSVSSTAYAATPGSFVVDRLSSAGVKGSEWRAEGGDPQWVAVDLQAACEVTQVRLTFEADASDPVYTPPTTGNVHSGTTGKEIQSSYSLVFVYRTTAGTGGVVDRQFGRSRTAGVDVAGDTAKAFVAEWTNDLPDLHLLVVTLEDARGGEVSRNTYWRYGSASALQRLNKPPPPRRRR
ncbi:galactose-binding domain-containing protein [Streptomyces lanatus]|uniref:galactose-binding domain-containing protein n=1 Tax=Streptomyces lanatus TaxID=66900 RepID=UPI003570B9BD